MTNYITKTIKNGVEANIPVTSVNGQYGDVVVAGNEYNAGPGISIGQYQDYSAMQGPAPDGFHVPTKAEWQGVSRIMYPTLNLGKDYWRIYLHLPFAGRRSYTNTNLAYQGTEGYYWSSDVNENVWPWSLAIETTGVAIRSNPYPTYAMSIRPFKDEYITPTSSWTVVQGTLGSAGIFWNQSEGLISITDGTNGYTMTDKNLGATTVYSDGDTLTQANMGNMYQWGNNYGFPSTGTIANQSTTQVDASSYGPGNYYSSDTFIKYSGRWDSTDNGNLWGGQTGVVTLDNAITNTGVLSVNGQTGDVTIESGGIQNDTTGTTSTVAKIRAGTEAEFNALSSKDATTIYHVF